MNSPMMQAIALATQGLGSTHPNPTVGCVLMGADGSTVLGEGRTQPAGQAHAEVMALRDARERGHSTLGAIAYVVLEPCSHFGRTPPCCNALIEAGVAKVVVALQDPNPLVGGQGLAKLRAAGIAVEVLAPDHPAAKAGFELNIGFLSRMRRKVPWVRMKIAASLDGKTALPNGKSQWITGPEARTDGHLWRARASAVLTGIGTVLQDQPRLDVRLPEVRRQPDLIIVDSGLETPPEAALFRVPERRVHIYAARHNPDRAAALEAQGAKITYLPGQDPSGAATGKVDLAAMVRDLAAKEFNEIHIEAGHKLNGSLLRAGLVDEFLVYLAPKLLGQGADMANFGPLTELAQALPLSFQSCTPVGPDLRILARYQGRDQF